MFSVPRVITHPSLQSIVVYRGPAGGEGGFSPGGPVTVNSGPHKISPPRLKISVLGLELS
jgi:hypothetical protein